MYQDLFNYIVSVGGFPVKFIPVVSTGSLSRPLNAIPMFNMGVLPSLAIICKLKYSVEDDDRQSMGVFIGTLSEWLPKDFAGNASLVCNDH